MERESPINQKILLGSLDLGLEEQSWASSKSYPWAGQRSEIIHGLSYPVTEKSLVILNGGVSLIKNNVRVIFLKFIPLDTGRLRF